ncbi:hypothetical protein RD110_00285 [Rhodoferax koreense]|uniref:DUF3274 domain-containing protein n=1 Tax=Rhodoferax koreensis TaxID=1842727 RepID=A0A1P8JQ21_9BURK|nr:DUF3274 domain-containing protein [Rhodoferax koreense]APW35844.1 hypothetical protein RD110_00285 [Rhodoferax koreense]
MKGLSWIDAVVPDPGKYQWVKGQFTGVEQDASERTYMVGIPHLMPGTIIFVHGVNSEGEWYGDAAAQFCLGLNYRLGRTDLTSATVDPVSKRFKDKTEAGKKPNSPIIPFYWGYSAARDAQKQIVKKEVVGSPDAITDQYGNPLERDGSWGGGPFQNGTNDLLSFWRKEGFNPKIGLIDVNWINPVLGRKLTPCPPRLYYAHAARRLAHLVSTIRTDFPNEPINIVAHSQGTMVALCALFYGKQSGLRGPDTVILNSSPYRFDTFATDFLTAANGGKEVQSAAARLKTFANAAAIVNESKTQFTYRPAPDAACTREHTPAHIHDDVIFIHQPADNPDWRAEIGAAPVKGELRWWSVPQHKRDNRGKLFVNFNPADRVIGVSAVEGIGWRGLPTKYFDAGNNQLGANVMQRLFVRGSNNDHNPAVGARTGYKQRYFYSQMERTQAASGDAGVQWRTGSGGALITENENWHYLDGNSPNTQWRVASERMLLVTTVHGDLSPRGDHGESESVYINAPVVPEPAVLGDDFDAKAVLFSGAARPAKGDQPAIEANTEQQATWKEFLKYQDREKLPATKQKVPCVDACGLPSTRYETDLELAQRLEQKVGQEVVSPTNHAQILRYGVDGAGPVSQVLSYDLTVGQGYAFHDEAYWNYLLDLADWKRSDPYFKSGALDPQAEAMPPGIDPETVSS